MRLILLFATLYSLFPSILSAEEYWSQWRGPSRDGHVTEISLPQKLDEASLPLKWSKPAGLSYSGPIVDTQRVFVTETRNRKTEVVRAFDRQTGVELWSTEWPGSLEVPFFAKANGDWIRATPATDGTRLYVAGMQDLLVCLDNKTGEQVWRYDFPRELKSEQPAFGFVSSPLLIGDAVFVQAGGGFCKLDKLTGKLLWQVLKDGGGMYGSAFSSPYFHQTGTQPQILVQTRTELAAVDPDLGTVFWKRQIPAFRGMNILTPTVYRNSVFTSSYGGASWLLEMPETSGELKELWKNKVEAYMSSPVVIGDEAFVHLKNQRFTCLDLKSGESKWTTQPYGNYWSMVTDGKIILALDEEGVLRSIAANPEKFEPLSERKVSKSNSWAHLAVSGNQIFVRDLETIKMFEWNSAE